MAGGATFNPKLLVDGERPFHLYPPASEMIPKIVLNHLKEPILPTTFAVALWPVYKAFATWGQNSSWGEAEFFTVLFITMITSAYIFINGFYALIEYQRWFEQFKIDRKPHHLGSWEQVRITLLKAVVGRLVIAPMLIYFVVCKLLSLRGMLQQIYDANGPSVPQLYLAFFAGTIFNELGFYWAHRTLHSTSLYAKFHKQHHEWKGTVSYAAEYAHPVEQIFANYIPTLGGCLVVGAHPWAFCVWVCERLRQTYEGHSGYAFDAHPLLTFLNITSHARAAEHDFHHTCNSGNFGPQWMDWLFGTMDAWAVAGREATYLDAKSDEKLSYMHMREKAEK